MYTFKHKILSVIVATVAAYFGFQSLDLVLSLYQIQTYFSMAWYVYAFHIIWLSFIFDLHLKQGGHMALARSSHQGAMVLWVALKSRAKHFYHWTYIRHYLNYLILPSVLFWSVIILMYLNPFFELFKDGLIIVTTAALSVTYWYFKEAISHHMELHKTGLKILSLVKVYAAYLTYSALIALGWYFGLSLSILIPIVFVITFLLIYQNLFQHRLMRVDLYPGILMFATLVSLVFVLIFQTWNVNYYTAGLFVAVVYTTCWSVIHKYFERELSWKLFWEHTFMLIVLMSVILATHDFQGRI